MALTDTITPLIDGDYQFVNILTNIIAANETSPDGWQFSAVKGWSGGHAHKLLSEGVIVSIGDKFSLTCNPADLLAILEPLHKLSPSTAKIAAIMDQKLSDADIQAFESLLQSEPCMVKYWTPFINPKVEGLENVKEALLLSIISQGDEFGDRGRIHVLMHGEPGCAKSILKDWIVSKLGAESCSQRTTSVGLTGDARGGEITPGALPRAHKTKLQVLCVDELDKFNHKDRQSLLEPMEEGHCIIEAGGMSERFETAVRIIACANKIMDFSPELLDRFDFIFNLKVPTGEEEIQILASIVTSWFDFKESYDGDMIRKYIHWIKDFKPGIAMTDRAKISVCMTEYAALPEVKKSIRSKQSILRVMYAVAKINRRNIIVSDFIGASVKLNGKLSDESMNRLMKVAGGR